MAAILQIYQISFREWKFSDFHQISLKFVPKSPTDNNPALV